MPAATRESLPTPGSILDLTPAAARTRLETWAAEQGLPRYRVGQLVRRLWQAPIARWADATDLNLATPYHRLEARVRHGRCAVTWWRFVRGVQGRA